MNLTKKMIFTGLLIMFISNPVFLSAATKTAATVNKTTTMAASFEQTKKMALNGNAEAQYILAMYILHGKADLKRDTKAAAGLLKKSAEQNNYKAHAALVEMAHNNECEMETGKQSLKWLQDQAEKENINAQFEMGIINEYGYIIPQNLKKALSWYTKCALKMHRGAHVKIGQCYESGYGIEKNYKKAKKFYENAVRLGAVNANWNLGRLYEKGLGVAKNNKKAAEYYVKAAKLGHPDSMTSYGIMLLQGRGVEQNDELAAKWLEQAARWGDAEAQFRLGTMYNKGLIEVELEKTDKLNSWLKLLRGKYIDPKIRAQGREGEKWLQKAADQNHKSALKYFQKKDTWMGWTFLIVGIIFLPISIGLFKWPDIAEKHNPFIIRYVSAPLTFLFSIGFLVLGFQSIFM